MRRVRVRVLTASQLSGPKIAAAVEKSALADLNGACIARLSWSRSSLRDAQAAAAKGEPKSDNLFGYKIGLRVQGNIRPISERRQGRAPERNRSSRSSMRCRKRDGIR